IAFSSSTNEEKSGRLRCRCANQWSFGDLAWFSDVLLANVTEELKADDVPLFISYIPVNIILLIYTVFERRINNRWWFFIVHLGVKVSITIPCIEAISFLSVSVTIRCCFALGKLWNSSHPTTI
ncbi:hypothetical protein Tcan_00595, partial [Toxocara canis]